MYETWVIIRDSLKTEIPSITCKFAVQLADIQLVYVLSSLHIYNSRELTSHATLDSFSDQKEWSVKIDFAVRYHWLSEPHLQGICDWLVYFSQVIKNLLVTPCVPGIRRTLSDIKTEALNSDPDISVCK